MENKDRMRKMGRIVRDVLPDVTPEYLEERKRKGLDHRDEMWEGILHMPPMPNCHHQEFQWYLETFLRRHLRRKGIEVYHEVNLASPGGRPSDYRIPDLVLIGPSRGEINRNDYIEGAPDVVVEIESPGDETREKMPFYAKIGVPEVWIVGRDTKAFEVHLLRGGVYERRPPGPGGWVASPFAGVEGRPRDGKLLLRLAGDDATLEALPED